MNAGSKSKSTKNWAEQESSDEGSLVDEEEEKDLPVSSSAANNIDASSSSYAVQAPSAGHKTVDDAVPLVAYISFLHPKATREAVGQFFQAQGCAINRIDIVNPRPRKFQDNRGDLNLSAMIEFKDVKSMDICLKLNSTKFMDQALRTAVYHSRRSATSSSIQEKNDYRGVDGRSRNRNAPVGTAVTGDRGHRAERSGSRSSHRGGSEQPASSRPAPHVMSAAAPPRVAPEVKAPPVARPRILLQPRTLPIEAVAQPLATNPSIFGGGKPQVESEYEEKRKKIAEVDDTPVEADGKVGASDRTQSTEGDSAARRSKSSRDYRNSSEPSGKPIRKSDRVRNNGATSERAVAVATEDTVASAPSIDLPAPIVQVGDRDSASADSASAVGASLVILPPAAAIDTSSSRKPSNQQRNRDKRRPAGVVEAVPSRNGRSHDPTQKRGAVRANAYIASAPDSVPVNTEASGLQSGEESRVGNIAATNSSGSSNRKGHQEDTTATGSRIRNAKGNHGTSKGNDAAKPPNRIFTAAAKQSNLLDSTSSFAKGKDVAAATVALPNGELAPSDLSSLAISQPTKALTEEQKFQRAQEKLQEKAHSKNTQQGVKKVNAFSMLGDDSD